MTNTPTQWLTRQEAADYLRVTTATLDRWVREKKLPRYRVANKASARFRAVDLDAIVRPEHPDQVAEFEDQNEAQSDA